MSTAVLALVAGLASLAIAIVIVASSYRARRHSEQRLARSLLEMGERMDTLARELATTLAKVRDDALRARIVESLGQTLDLDEVMARSAEAAMALPGVAAAALRIEQLTGLPLFASAGLDDAAIHALSGPPGDVVVRAIGISYHYPPGEDDARPIRSAIAVPLVVGGKPAGFLTVFGHGEEPPVGGNEFKALEAIAAHTGPAIANARRLIDAAQAPEADALTGLGTRGTFHEELSLEVARALRKGLRLAICVLDLDDCKAMNDRIGHLAGDLALAEVADTLRQSLHANHLAYRTGGDEFGVILHGAGRIDAEALFARLQATLRRLPPSLAPALSLSAGIAELQPLDDGVSILERAESALSRAKHAGKGTAA